MSADDPTAHAAAAVPPAVPPAAPVAPTAPTAPTALDALRESIRIPWHSPYPATLQDASFRLLDVNAAYIEFTGYSREALLGIDPLALQPEEDQAASAAARVLLEEGAVKSLVDRRIIDAHGRERWFRASRHLLRDADGRPVVFSLLQDSTAEHIARDRADRSARELDNWFDLSPLGMVLFDTRGLLVRTNAAFEALVGTVPVQLSEAAEPLRQLLGWGDGHALAALQPGAAPLEGQAFMPLADGSLRRLRSVVRCYRTAEGHDRYMAAVEDRSVEEERDIAQMQIGAMMDTAGVALATFQESSGWLRQNIAPPTAPGGLAASSAALQNISRDIVMPESIGEYETLQHALRHAQRAEVRYAIRHPELGLRWLLTRVEPGRLASGKRTTSIVTLDITDQHLAQQRGEQLLREMTTILESTTVGIAYLRDNVLVRCNRRFEAMLGLRSGASAGSGLRELFGHDPQALRIGEEAMRVLAEGHVFEAEFEVAAAPPGPEGLRPWYSLSVRRAWPSTGVVEAIAVLTDVSRLKLQQRELQVLARDRELMFNLSEVGLAFLRNGRIERANEALAALTGWSVAELATLEMRALFPDEVEYEMRWPQEERDLRVHGRWSGERQLRQRDGRLIWVQAGKRLVNQADPAGGMIASYVNVDARHRAEQAVALQAARTRAILDSVLVGIVTVGPMGIEWMNRSARRMFGGDLTDFINQPISTVAPDEPDHPFRQTQYLNELVEGQAETFECRVAARDGREFWVVGNAVATGRDAAGRQLTYALLDIERRRQAEARMSEAQSSLQRIIEAAPLAITLRDAHSLRILQLNQVALAGTGRALGEVIGAAPEDLYAPEVAAMMRSDMDQALGSPEVTQREYRVNHNGDEQIWDARYLPLAKAGQSPDQLLMVATDVTEQRAAQEARFKAALAQREMLVKEVHHRIKNNLQGVAGLLQQIAQRKPEVAGAISEVVGQVQAIAQVYGLQVGAGGTLRLHSVAEAIVASLQRTFGRSIGFEVGGEAPYDWALPEAESIPIALTLNELLTNAIKHSRAAVEAKGDGGVGCSIDAGVDEVRIEIANEGLLPPEFNLARMPGGVSGLGLVRALLPRRSATLAIAQRGARVVATVALKPPGVARLGEAAGPAAPPASGAAGSAR